MAVINNGHEKLCLCHLLVTTSLNDYQRLITGIGLIPRATHRWASIGFHHLPLIFIGAILPSSARGTINPQRSLLLIRPQITTYRPDISSFFQTSLQALAANCIWRRLAAPPDGASPIVPARSRDILTKHLQKSTRFCYSTSATFFQIGPLTVSMTMIPFCASSVLAASAACQSLSARACSLFWIRALTSGTN